MQRKLNRWIMGVLAALALVSGNLLFDLSGIRISTSIVTGLIYATSVFGFLYLYSGLVAFATSVVKPNTSSRQPPTST
jgi:hypothetical protein